MSIENDGVTIHFSSTVSVCVNANRATQVARRVMDIKGVTSVEYRGTLVFD
jgi:alanine racemase